MKKTMYVLSFFCIFLQFISCKSNKKKEIKETTPIQKTVVRSETDKQVNKEVAAFSLAKATNKIDWVAYKTTEKVPVKASFKKVNITANGAGNSIKEAVNNAEFSIPVSSIFTNDSSRDFKIRKFFFKIMNTQLLSGKLVLTDDSKGYGDITMNGITQKLPFSYTISGKTFNLKATMDLKLWKAQKALKALNAACKALHTGKDGISKTWDEVAIDITSVFQ